MTFTSNNVIRDLICRICIYHASPYFNKLSWTLMTLVAGTDSWNPRKRRTSNVVDKVIRTNYFVL